MARPYYFDPYDPSTREKIEYDFTEDSDAGRQHKKREELRLLLEAEEAIAKAKKAKRNQIEMERIMKKEQEQARKDELDKLERLRKEKEVRDSLRGIRH